MLTFNPASPVELASGKRPEALLWTAEHVERWRATGEKPSGVMVWTPKQVGQFLDHAERDRLYALFCLIAFLGLRRGEAVGQAWPDIDLVNGTLRVSKTIIQDGWTPVESGPKTGDSQAVIALGPAMVETLRHGTIQLAGDTYTSLLPHVDQEVARKAESVGFPGPAVRGFLTRPLTQEA
ncbi:hypothetical protein [Streptomyces griseus]|uniref:hypothetical protein n=1 Tax=Streptomyces TaxID=1883 RepID=UPI00374E043E